MVISWKSLYTIITVTHISAGNAFIFFWKFPSLSSNALSSRKGSFFYCLICLTFLLRSIKESSAFTLRRVSAYASYLLLVIISACGWISSAILSTLVQEEGLIRLIVFSGCCWFLAWVSFTFDAVIAKITKLRVSCGSGSHFVSLGKEFHESPRHWCPPNPFWQFRWVRNLHLQVLCQCWFRHRPIFLVQFYLFWSRSTDNRCVCVFR